MNVVLQDFPFPLDIHIHAGSGSNWVPSLRSLEPDLFTL